MLPLTDYEQYHLFPISQIEQQNGHDPSCFDSSKIFKGFHMVQLIFIVIIKWKQIIHGG